MNKRFAVSTLAVAIAVFAHADLASDWQKILDSYCAAAMKKDVKAADKIIVDNFASDFQFIPLKGPKVGLKSWIAQGHEEMKMTEKMNKVELHIDSMKMVNKDKAVMRLSIVFAGTMKLDPKGKVGLMVSKAKAEQTVVRKGNKWWIQEIKSISESATFNGQAIKM